MYNWTVNSGFGVNGVDDAQDCVMRFRYNITTADTQVRAWVRAWVRVRVRVNYNSG